MPGRTSGSSFLRLGSNNLCRRSKKIHFPLQAGDLKLFFTKDFVYALHLISQGHILQGIMKVVETLVFDQYDRG